MFPVMYAGGATMYTLHKSDFLPRKITSRTLKRIYYRRYSSSSASKKVREKNPSLSLSVTFLYMLKVMPLLATPTMKNMRVNMA